MRDLTAAYPVAKDVPSTPGVHYWIKRVFDVALASVALLATSPLWLIFSLAIIIEDRGPVFYPQKRWGRGKKAIRVRKFRTMVVDADAKYGPVQAQENDPRVTRVGYFLRATSLDEMPQILSILRGDMSWVGPRPLPINEMQINEENGSAPDDAIPGFEARCRVTPGLTGMAQVYAPRDVPRRHKFRYDMIYIRNQNLWLDIRLILMSLWITFRGKWEFRGRKF